ncbi:hypothetical protein AWZ03_006434 [Drosophila navojoa]|uniref:WKF domain-containing protein n=1 Tax=Drosophila navojoa TaxID=7232 RepID=A0A484BEL6_DRONA|nr:uncharacterized protein C7orf50 homolog [Drosophila navojoa]TDG47169.1 hypothetical protein AWZ03_006434 [Drosophila navojoa]
MARTELDMKKQKRKAKKRKHETQAVPSDDEVANKSLIVEDQVAAGAQKAEKQAKKNKAAKRRQQSDQDAIKEKRSKQIEEPEEDAVEDEELDDLPTADLLEQAAKPENSNAIVTVRQKKKQKHLQRLEEQKDQNADKESRRNEEYLRKWRDSRQDWKFEKLRQISIQQTAFNENKLSADIWPIALEYLAGSKGAAKATIIKLAEDAIQEMDKQCEGLSEEAERQKIVDSVRYQRARNLLQSFD